jgi:hypothetical protein
MELLVQNSNYAIWEMSGTTILNPTTAYVDGNS